MALCLVKDRDNFTFTLPSDRFVYVCVCVRMSQQWMSAAYIANNYLFHKVSEPRFGNGIYSLGFLLLGHF